MHLFAYCSDRYMASDCGIIRLMFFICLAIILNFGILIWVILFNASDELMVQDLRSNS